MWQVSGYHRDYVEHQAMIASVAPNMTADPLAQSKPRMGSQLVRPDRGLKVLRFGLSGVFDPGEVSLMCHLGAQQAVRD